jgi:hypothetical protein
VPSSGKLKTYLVECFWPGIGERKLASAVNRAQAAARELRREGREIWLLGSILIRADETVFFVFEGAEADVRAASAKAAVPFERVLESVQIDSEKTRAQAPGERRDAAPSERA